MGVIDYFLLVVALFLITLVVLQGSKDNVNNAFSGEKSELFNNQKQRGYELILSRVTMGVSLVFIVSALVAMLS
jgi:preprotein translocase subunit SecG